MCPQVFDLPNRSVGSDDDQRADKKFVSSKFHVLHVTQVSAASTAQFNDPAKKQKTRTIEMYRSTLVTPSTPLDREKQAVGSLSSVVLYPCTCVCCVVVHNPILALVPLHYHHLLFVVLLELLLLAHLAFSATFILRFVYR